MKLKNETMPARLGQVLCWAACVIAGLSGCATPSIQEERQAAICLRDALVVSGLAPDAKLDHRLPFFYGVTFRYVRSSGRLTDERLDVLKHRDKHGQIQFWSGLSEPDFSRVGEILESKCPDTEQIMLIY